MVDKHAVLGPAPFPLPHARCLPTFTSHAMQIKVLGCSGGIDTNTRTTGFLLDEDTLIDAGTGVCDLPLKVQLGIEQVFLTHAHFDHLIGLPFLADNVSRHRLEVGLPPIKVYARASVLDDLRQFILNNHIWPDFTRLPTLTRPTLECIPVDVGSKTMLSHDRCVEAISAVHSVPSVGYAVHQQEASWVFTGDTGRNPLLWQYINSLPAQGQKLHWLVAEVTFADEDQAFADLTGHFTAHSLAQDLQQLQHGHFDIYLTHLKPSDRARIITGLQELQAVASAKNCRLELLNRGHVFDSLNPADEKNIKLFSLSRY